MKPWSIVVMVIAALAIVVLLIEGGNEHRVAGQAREGADERAAQQLVGMPVGVGPGAAVTMVLERDDIVPPEAASLLGEARDLIDAATAQPADQAQATLEQALDRLKAAREIIDTAADDTSPSNVLTKVRLERISRTLDGVQAVIELRLEQL